MQLKFVVSQEHTPLDKPTHFVHLYELVIKLKNPVHLQAITVYCTILIHRLNLAFISNVVLDNVPCKFTQLKFRLHACILNVFMYAWTFSQMLVITEQYNGRRKLVRIYKLCYLRNSIKQSVLALLWQLMCLVRTRVSI